MESILKTWFPAYKVDEKKGFLAGQTRVVFETIGPLDVVYVIDKSERRFKTEVKRLQNNCKERDILFIGSVSCTPPTEENVPNKLYIYTHVDINPYRFGTDIDFVKEQTELFNELMQNVDEVLLQLVGDFFLNGVEKFPNLLKFESFRAFKELLDRQVRNSIGEIETSNAELSRLYA